ncbi:I78 family peptidase inhibitor [Paracoccus beibuensis]|uniref:I78 family peptidase inhibitor n=1 Tax=Paracoccus beibuensis TaxID=547602 RepID=UPI00223FD12B|nr:I78 family peptidase inhibitor [Paracoccus beibuensis]
MTALPRYTPRPTLLALPAILLAVSACGGNPYDVASRTCDPAQHQALVGRNVGEILLPPSLPKREVMTPGVMTRDFNPARLTMYVDPKGWVTGISCG